jgi:hypothetical protein
MCRMFCVDVPVICNKQKRVQALSDSVVGGFHCISAFWAIAMFVIFNTKVLD